jgi:hypothetical protein
VPLHRRPDEQVLRRLWIGLTNAATVEPGSMSGELRLRGSVRNAGPSDPAISEALRRLDAVRPELVPCSQLFGSRGALPVDFLMNAMASGAIDGVLTPFNVTSQIGEFPTASPLVRLQARQGGRVTNQKSEPVQLDGLMSYVAQRLDGARNRSALADDIAQQVASNAGGADSKLALLDTAANPSELTDMCLRFCRDHALLIATPARGAGV